MAGSTCAHAGSDDTARAGPPVFISSLPASPSSSIRFNPAVQCLFLYPSFSFLSLCTSFCFLPLTPTPNLVSLSASLVIPVIKRTIMLGPRPLPRPLFLPLPHRVPLMWAVVHVQWLTKCCECGSRKSSKQWRLCDLARSPALTVHSLTPPTVPRHYICTALRN